MSVLLSPGAINARPLTPPIDVEGDIESALQFLRDDAITSPRLSVRVSQNTPPSSSPFRSSPLRSKKVGFHPTPTFLATPGRRDDRPQFKLKSILKTSSPLPTPDESRNYFLHDQEGGVLNMLDSAVKHLDREPRDARLDAYLAINGALAAYDDMPSIDQWKHHLRSLQQHVCRDIRARDLVDSVDTNIVIQAIKLAAYMVNNEQIVNMLEHDFQTGILDKITAALDDSSKQITKTCVGFLSQQRMHPSHLTTFRLEKILAALNKIDHNGRGAVIARMLALKRLADQVPSSMLATMAQWLPHLVSGMLSDVPEVRSIAIDVGMHVAILFGKHIQATETLHNLFETENEGTRYFEHFTLSLANMLKTKSSKLHVPQIWTVISIMHRHQRFPIHTWRRFRAWLLVLQECMNCSEVLVKQQAILAWRKLVYLIQPDAKTPDKARHLLKEPIRSGFHKSGSDRAAKQARQSALDSYYNLLHYALRPSLQHHDLDVAWSNYVVELLHPMILASSKGRSIACAVLSGVQTPNTGSWNADAVLEDAAILPQDLPRLDPRWVRSRIADVLKLVESILERSLLADEDQFLEACGLWDDTVRSVLEAAAQEVKPSAETKVAAACLLSTLRRLWCSSRTEKSLSRLSDLITFTTTSIGLSLMSEQFIYTQQHEHNVTATTSPQPQQKPMTPLIFLFTFSGSAAAETAMMLNSLKTIMLSQHVDLHRQWLLPAWSALHQRRELGSILTHCWTVITMLAVELINQRVSMNWSSSDLDIHLHDAQQLLIYGLGLEQQGIHKYRVMHSLTNTLLSVASSQTEDSSHSCIIIEEIAKHINQAIIRQDVIDRQSMWSCLKNTFSAAHSSHAQSMPFSNLLSCFSILSHEWYDSSDLVDIDEVSQLLAGTTRLVMARSEHCKKDALAKLADIVSPWLSSTVLEARSNCDLDAFCKLVLQCVDELLNASLPHLMSDLLLIEQCLEAALASTIPGLEEQTRHFWHKHIATLPDIVLPDKLVTVVSANETLARSRAAQEDPDSESLPPGHDQHDHSVTELETRAFKHLLSQDSIEQNALCCDPSLVELDHGTTDPPDALPSITGSDPHIGVRTLEDDQAILAGATQKHNTPCLHIDADRTASIEHRQAASATAQPHASHRPGDRVIESNQNERSEDGHGEMHDLDSPALAAEDAFEALAQQTAVQEVAHLDEHQQRITSHGHADAMSDEPARSKDARRPRHDDSQVDFATIPAVSRADSQLLTDHQREVRDRQHDATAQYPDLSSSPAPPPVSPLADSSPASQASARSTKRKRTAAKRTSRSQPVTPDADAQLQHEAEVAYRATQASEDSDETHSRKKRKLRSASQDSPSASARSEPRTRRSTTDSQRLPEKHAKREKRSSQRLSQETSSQKRSRFIQEDGDEIVVAIRSSQLTAEVPPSVSPSGTVVNETSAIESSAPDTDDMLGRLKTVLHDLRRTVLPADAERTFDDMLFSLRQAAFEAGRRARTD